MIGLGLDTTMDMVLKNNFAWDEKLWYHRRGIRNSTKRKRKSRMSIRRIKRHQRRFAQRHNRK